MPGGPLEDHRGALGCVGKGGGSIPLGFAPITWGSSPASRDVRSFRERIPSVSPPERARRISQMAIYLKPKRINSYARWPFSGGELLRTPCRSSSQKTTLDTRGRMGAGMGRGSNSPGPARLARSDLESPSPGLRDLLVLLPGAPAHAYGSHHPTAVPDQRHAAREDPDAPPVGDVDAVELPPGLGRCGQVLGGDIEGAGGEGLVDGDVDGADPRPVHARVRDEVPPRVDHRYVHGLADLLSLALGGGDHPPCVLEGYTVCHRLSSFPPAPPRRTLKLPTNNHDATTPTPVRTSENYPSPHSRVNKGY